MKPNKILPGIFLFILITLFVDSCKDGDPVYASFTTSSTEVNRGDSIHFLNRSENASHYQWDLGDGTTSSLKDPSHVYNVAGSYKVTLISFGNEDSDTASLNINVLQTYDVTIYEGIGIEGVDLFEVWGNIKAIYTSDTIYRLEYFEELELYNHFIGFYEEGVAFNFASEDTIIDDDEQAWLITVVLPYEGATDKGIRMGTTMARVLVKYGEPESVIEGEDYYAYWYDAKGVDFYSFENDLVDRIDIYYPIIDSTKTAERQVSSINESRFRRSPKILIH